MDLSHLLPSPPGLDLILFCLQQEKQRVVGKVHAWEGHSLDSNPSFATLSCVTLGKLRNLSDPRLLSVLSLAEPLHGVGRNCLSSLLFLEVDTKEISR